MEGTDMNCGREMAAAAAAYYSTLRFNAHRGVEVYPRATPPVLVAFGNDGYQVDPRSRSEVEQLREEVIQTAGLQEVGFAVSPDGYSWAMVLRYHGRLDEAGRRLQERLDAALWAAWQQASNTAEPVPA